MLTFFREMFTFLSVTTRNVKAIVQRLLEVRPVLRNRDLASALGISRQAAHRHLCALVEAGELVREGAGRGVVYRRAGETRASFTYPTAGLAEDRVWRDLAERCAPLAALTGAASDLFQYAVTELVNNAIDHSGADAVTLFVHPEPPRLTVEVVDEGVGIFRHLRHHLGLATDLEALQELSKGKTTTLPDRHTGEGIFFVSKAADRFEIVSGSLRWLVDNLRDDMAVEEVVPPVAGTRVRFEASPARPCDLVALFERYTEKYAFTRTRAVVRLFAIGVRFVSRSEAKRLLHGLERFREVVLDFGGVKAVGQGFCDELFRVWAHAHPETRLLPVKMEPTVAFMVERARRHP